MIFSQRWLSRWGLSLLWIIEIVSILWWWHRYVLLKIISHPVLVTLSRVFQLINALIVGSLMNTPCLLLERRLRRLNARTGLSIGNGLFRRSSSNGVSCCVLSALIVRWLGLLKAKIVHSLKCWSSKFAWSEPRISVWSLTFLRFVLAHYLLHCLFILLFCLRHVILCLIIYL